MDSIPLAEDLIFDVGMHRGEDSAYYLSKGFRVVGFEANPTLANRCRERLADEIEAGTMTIVQGAIDDRERETVGFFVDTDPELSVWGTTDQVWATRNAASAGNSRTIEVPTVDFSAALRRFGVPHYLKVDIEGADLICLRALEQCEQRPAYVSIESEKTDWPALEAEVALLDSLGYSSFAVCQQADMENREIDTRARDGSPLHYRFEPGSSGPFGDDIAEPWTDSSVALARYREIFRQYRAFGDGSLMGRTRPGRGLRQLLSRGLRRQLPGWYDTHATRLV